MPQILAAALITAAVALVIELLCYTLIYTGLTRRRRSAPEAQEPLPSVSVVVVAHNRDTDLRAYLPLLLEQDYPDYDVIVVNDSSWDDTDHVIEQLQATYPHLETARIPAEARLISNKKFGILLAALHSRKDILLFTEPTTRPYSPHWIRMMVSNFSAGIDYVTAPFAIDDRSTMLQHAIAYDMLTIEMRTLGLSRLGCHIAGYNRNMAYRRTEFFARKGFAGTMHKTAGEDDLIISRHAHRANARYESRAEAHTIEMEQYTLRSWRYEKQRQCSTLTDYSTAGLMLIRLEPTARYIYYIAGTLALILALRAQLTTVALALAAGYVVKAATQLAVVNIEARRLHQRRFGPSALIFDILLPIISATMLLFTPRAKNLY